MSENKGILVFGEVINGNLSSVTTEALGCGRQLANELQETLSSIFLVSEIGDLTQKAIKYGSDKVYTIIDPVLKDYQNESFAMILENAIKVVSPRLMLFGQTSIGRDLAPTLAFKLGSGLSMDCLDIKLNAETKRFELTRSVYGGNAQAIFISESMPQIATIRQKAMSPLTPDDSRKGEIINLKAEYDANKIRTKILDTIKEEITGIKLEDATIVITGGRGMGGNTGFKQLEDVAKILKGAVGATRPPCDNGWWPETAQVGLTGKIVSPDMYIAVAVSGASQHMAGCSGAKNIIAINKDPESNIFKYARFGVIGDWKQILPPFTENLKKLVAG